MARRAALLGGAALLGLYFAAAVFSQMPLTPAKLRHYDKVAAVLDPYLTQNWMLFAPDPLSENRGILARARCAGGSTTPFYDVTAKYVEQTRHSRFFPSRMARLVSGNVQELTGGDPLVSRLRDSEREKKKPREIPLTPFEKTTQDEALRFLSRYSLTQLPDVCGGKPERIQIRVYAERLPPWSQRHNPGAEATTSVRDMRWLKAEELS